MRRTRAWVASELGIVLDADGKAPFEIDGVPYVLSIRESPSRDAFDLLAYHEMSSVLIPVTLENEPDRVRERVLERFREQHRCLLAWADALRAATPSAL